MFSLKSHVSCPQQVQLAMLTLASATNGQLLERRCCDANAMEGGDEMPHLVAEYY